ncbi:hypothetical protein LJC58_02170 [Lachnospiraceae bacterium OttesenSCG-928-D06]|nr:hypothetical protein [Lachnospiraceae bacterium OttesenSCG-928-D06]
MEKIKEFAEKYNTVCYTDIPEGWEETKGATTAPAGAMWINNGKSRFSEEYESGLFIKEGYLC